MTILLNMMTAYLSNVKMYLGLAESLPPESRVPNWPIGCRRLMLLLPTKFCAKLTIVDMSDCSPWWYDECSATEPANWATLISRLSLRFKQVNSTCKIFNTSSWTFGGSVDYIFNLKQKKQEESFVYLAQCRSKMCEQIKTDGTVTCHEKQFYCEVCHKLKIQYNLKNKK